jgi:hypothetical protein
MRLSAASATAEYTSGAAADWAKSHAAQQPPGDARSAARAARDLVGTVRGQLKAEQAGGAADDLLELVDAVESQAHGDSETVAQGRGDKALAGRGADQGELGKVDPDGARGGTLADHQVERAVLHRGIEDLLDRWREAVDLVDEQHVAVLEIGEQGGKVARLCDHRPRRGAEADAKLARDDLGQRRLAEARRAEEEHMVERVAAPLRGIDEDPQILPRRLLADEIVERLRPERGVDILGPAIAADDALLLHGTSLAPSGLAVETLYRSDREGPGRPAMRSARKAMASA